MKKKLSNTWLIVRHGVEKYLVKNFEIFVPSSAGDSNALGKHTAISINLIFPLLSRLMEVLRIKTEIHAAGAFCIKIKKCQNQKTKKII